MNSSIYPSLCTSPPHTCNHQVVLLHFPPLLMCLLWFVLRRTGPTCFDTVAITTDEASRAAPVWANLHTQLHIRTQQRSLSRLNPNGDVNKQPEQWPNSWAQFWLDGCVRVEPGSTADHRLKMKVLSSENKYFQQGTQIFAFHCSFRARNSEEIERRLHERSRLVLNN